MGLFDKVVKGVANAASSASVNAVNSVTLRKYETEVSDLNAKYDECYLIIGKRIAESLRSGEEVNDPRVKEAFKRIEAFDIKKGEIEAKIRELKGEQSSLTEAQRLVELESEAEKEIQKLKELLELGVDTQEEFDRKAAGIRNKVIHFKKLEALSTALSKKLISEEDYKAKRAAILGQDIVE